MHINYRRAIGLRVYVMGFEQILTLLAPWRVLVLIQVGVASLNINGQKEKLSLTHIVQLRFRLAEGEGFVLDFCSTFWILSFVTFRKNLRSPFTKQRTVLFCSLRSNPVYILRKAKTERLLAFRFALAEREGFVLDFCSTFGI